MKTFHLEVVAPDCTPFCGEAERLLVKTTEGYVEILPDHTDYLAVIDTGKAKITVNGTARLASVSGCFLSVKKNNVKLVVNTFEFADEIDVNRALRAKEAAERALAETSDKEKTAKARAKLMRALTRISVAKNK